MQKRYLVFISSTFADLEDERKTVMHAIQKTGYFVAGMELFASDDADSWEVIKRAIDQSDYYVLVIAGRYGSIAPDGLSFTEKEYHYAREKNIPVLAFVHANRDVIPSGKVEKTHTSELEKFIKLVNANHNRTTWTTKDDLATNVLATLTQSAYLRPGIGWVRGGVEREKEGLRQRLDDLQQRYERVREERDALHDELSAYSARGQDLAWAADTLCLKITETREDLVKTHTIETTWEKVFKALSPSLIGWQTTETIEERLLLELAPSRPEGTRSRINADDITLIRSQFAAKGLIDIDREPKTHALAGYVYQSEHWRLTSKGVYEMSVALAQRRSSEK